MRIAQRGTTSTVDNNYGCVDRWFKYSNGDTSTWGQATDPVHGTYAYWVAKSNGYGNLRQRIEPFFVPTEGLNYTASFWMKISSGTAPLRYEIWNNSENSLIKANMNHDTLTTEWKKYTINFRLDSNDSMDNWHIMLGSNSAPANVTFYLTKCQIERGDIATDFEHRSIGEELALCQRYFQKIGKAGHGGLGKNDYLASGFVDSNGSAFYGGANLKVTMRTSPSISINGTASHLGYTHPAVAFTATGLNNYWSNPQSYVINLGGTGSGTTGYGAYARITDDATQLEFNAEL